MRRFLTIAGTFAGLLLPIFGQQDDDAARGVARVSVVNGDVSIRRGDSGDQVAATVNAPLLAPDRLVTGVGAHAELQFDFANMLRLSGNTEVRLAELQNQRVQLNIPVGLVTFRVVQNSQTEVDINTPVLSVRPLRPGQYRIQVLEDGATEVTVREGEVDIYTPQGSRKLGQGKTLTVRAAAEGVEPSFQVSNAMGLDSWDVYNRGRDQELAASRSQQYLPQGVYGGEQLDNYGDWVYSAPYGNVWQPRVDSGWAPYRTGRWSWLDWYGWSWTSYDPWGWAPYHYGRWFNNSGRWCWWPGAYGSRHYWSPALVSFFGFGGRGGLSVGFGFGNVGWVPLAPYETHNRWWGRGYYGGRGGFNNTTIINNTNITNIYRNARVNGGVSYVEADNFNRGLGSQGGRNGYPSARQQDLQNAGEVRGQLGIAPGRESVGFARQEGIRNGGVATRDDQRFTARREANPVERVPFEQQRQSLSRGQESAGRGGSQSSGFVDRGGNAQQNANGIQSRQSNDGFVRREGGNSAPDNGSVRGGWQRFGDAGVNTGASRGQNTEGFVQRDRSTMPGNSGSVGVSPRIVERGSQGFDNGGSRGGNTNFGGGAARESGVQQRQSQGSSDPYGGSSRGGSVDRSSGWSGFGGVRGGGAQQQPQQQQQSAPRGNPGYGGGGGGYSAPRMSAPPSSSGGGGGGGRGSAPASNGGGGGGSRGTAASGGSHGGGRR